MEMYESKTVLGKKKMTKRETWEQVREPLDDSLLQNSERVLNTLSFKL